jgi:peptidase E
MPERQIVAMGGYPDDALLGYVLGLARGRKLLFVPTASREDPGLTLTLYERLHGQADMTHLHFFPWPPRDLRRLALEHDVILVTGGNTATPSPSGARTAST